MRCFAAIVVSLLLSVVTAIPVLAQAPDSLSFQGKLTDTNGNPTNQNGLSMTFRMYKDLSVVWTETQSVDVVDGVFDVYLGKVTPLDTVAFDEPITIGIKVQGDASEMSPRTPLVAAAYALGMRGMYAVAATNGPHSAPNLMGGASHNFVAVGVVGATIGGGGGWQNGSPRPDSVLGDWGTVAGGFLNTAGNTWATVGGGGANKATRSLATVGGGGQNRADGFYSTIGGGSSNTSTGLGATVGGGSSNTAAGNFATVGGGQNNNASGQAATVGGGDANEASSDAATVGGGSLNEASAFGATVGGGVQNTATGLGATIPGGRTNVASKGYTFAAGRRAQAIHSGTFVWADSNSIAGTTFSSTDEDQFLIRAAGGVGIGTNGPEATVHVMSGSLVPQMIVENTSTTNFARVRMNNSAANYWDIAAGGALNGQLNFFSNIRPDVLSLRSTGDPVVAYNGAKLTHAGVWTSVSSEAVKTDFTDLDVRSILHKLTAMRISQWRYKVEPNGVRHIGPTAEQFSEVFGLGEDDATIGMVDADGVALAAIQGLYELVQDLQAENAHMRAVMARAGLE